MGYEVSNMKSALLLPLLAQLPPPSSHLPTGTPQLQARLSSSSSKLLGEATANLWSQHGTNLWPSSTDTHQPLLAMLTAPQLASHFAIPTATSAMPPKRLRSKSSRPCLLTSSPLPLLARTRKA